MAETRDLSDSVDALGEAVRHLAEVVNTLASMLVGPAYTGIPDPDEPEQSEEELDVGRDMRRHIGQVVEAVNRARQSK